MSKEIGYKNNLFMNKESNEILSNFFPNEFYTTKNFDTQITKENLIPRTNNLNRNLESNFIYQKSIFFNVEEVFSYLRNLKLENCYILLKYNFENLLNLFDQRNKYRKIPKLEEKVQQLFVDNTISHSIYFHSMKIVDLLNLYDPLYKKIGNSNQISFKRIDTLDNKNQYRDAIIILQNFCDLLFIFDKDEYEATIVNIKINLDKI
jgi:hypothetical protein